MTVVEGDRTVPQKQLYDARYKEDYMSESTPLETFKTRATLIRIDPNVKEVLDYGCGQGSKIETISEAFPGSNIVGIDISNEAVKKAGAKHSGHDFVLFDGGNAPFRDESFDLVFSFHVLEHVRNLKDTVRDMSRLVRPGKFLCAILPCGNPGSFEQKIVTLVRNGHEASETGEVRWFFEDESHLRRPRSSDLAEAFEENGFLLVDQTYAFRSWGGVLNVCRYGPMVANRMLAVRRGKTISAKAILFVLKPLLVSSSLIFLVFARSPLYVLFDRLWLVEWADGAKRSNGSEQYLLFRKKGNQPVLRAPRVGVNSE